MRVTRITPARAFATETGCIVLPVRHKGVVYFSVVADRQQAAKVCAHVFTAQQVLFDAKGTVRGAAVEVLKRLDL
jgi:hypothetical protein